MNDSEDQRFPLRAVAMLLISLAIVLVGIGVARLITSDESTQDSAGTTAQTTASQGVTPERVAGDAAQSGDAATAANPAAETPAAAAAQPDPNVPVHVLNGSTVTGLAAQTADQLRRQGYNVADVANYAGEPVPATVVYYLPEAEAAGRAVAAQLGVEAQAAPAGFVLASGVAVVLAGN